MKRFLYIEVIFFWDDDNKWVKHYTIPYSTFEKAKFAAETLERNSARLPWFLLVQGHILKPPVTVDPHNSFDPPNGDGETVH